MKKGCFIKSIFILTIFTAAIIYLIENKGKDFFFRQGKDLAKEFLVNDFQSELSFVIDSPQKDSLKLLLKDIAFNLEKFSNLSDDEVTIILSKFEIAFSDSIISKSELSDLKKIFKERLEK